MGNHIAGAALDVYRTEPISGEDMRFLKLDNVVLSPHLAGASQDVYRHHSRIMVDDLLLASKNQYLYSIMAEERSPVGLIWFAVEDAQSQRRAFIYDFIIFEPFRRRGYGSQALLAVEEKVSALGLQSIGLHVFGHNHGALALYKKMGYKITNVNMAKPIEAY